MLLNRYKKIFLSRRVIHIVESLNPLDGGPSNSVPTLFGARLNAGFQDLIATVHLGKNNTSEKFLEISFRSYWGKLRASPQLLKYLIQNREHYDIVHINCVWNLVFISSFLIAKIFGKKIILSPRGMLRLEHLRRSSIKTLILHSVFKVIFKLIDVFHITSEWEGDDLVKIGVSQKKIVSIFNPIKSRPNRRTVPVVNLDKTIFTYLYVGRIHPYKRVIELIDSYISLSDYCHKMTRLILVGPCSDVCYTKKIKRKIETSPEHVNIIYLGFLNDEKLAWCYEISSAFVMPSKSENFGMSILEALQYKKQVIVPSLSPWRKILPAEIMEVVKVDASNLRECLIQARKKKIPNRQVVSKLETIIKQFNANELVEKYTQMYELV